MKSSVLVVLVTLTSSMAYPAMYPSRSMYYDGPEFDDFYYPYAFDQPVQSRSFDNYIQPYGLPGWPPVNSQDTSSRTNQPAEWRENVDYSDFNQDYVDAPITYIPFTNNGAIAGPLAFVPGKPQNSDSSNALKTEYYTIIDGPNWPFIEESSKHGKNPAYNKHSHEHGRSSLPLDYQPDNHQEFSLPYRPFYFPFYYLYRY